GDRAAVLAEVARTLADHQARLRHYQQLAQRDHPDPAGLRGHDLDTYLVLLGGLRLEEFWVSWLTECLAAHGLPTPSSTAPVLATHGGER
ncbi:MAG TPA: hypothetical protein PLP61_15350, partial [Nocardioides sp.]|nr:hypothetical protein [Nocardioides sp.]